MTTLNLRNFKRDTGQWTWLHMDAVLTLHGSTALPLLALLVALGGKNHCITTYTKSLATRLCVNRRTVQLAYKRLEGQGYIVRTYEHSTGRVTITIHPSAYPPRFVKSVSGRSWPVMPIVDVPAQISRRRKQAAAADLALYRVLGAKMDSPVKTLSFNKNKEAWEKPLGDRAMTLLESVRAERLKSLARI